MKRTQLEKIKGKKIGGAFDGTRGGQGMAVSRREQALEAKRELLRKLGKSK